MKVNFVKLLICTSILMSACKKEKTNNTDASVNLTELTYFKDNHDETITDRSGAWRKTSYFTKVDQDSKVFIDLGEKGTSNTQALFGISFMFNNINILDSISGTYTFPAANQFMKVVLRNQIAPGRDERYLLPFYGKVSFVYDPVLNQVSGKIENLEFNTLGVYPFDRNKIIIKGTFERISKQ